MQISVTPSSYGNVQSTGRANSFAQVKKDFEALGSALESGDLEQAQEAFAQLQKDAPAPNGKNNPLSDKIESLGQALDSGDLESAQDAYEDIEKTIAQGPPRRGAGGPPPGEAGGPGRGGGGGGSKSDGDYDKRDTNKDGTVSAQEALLYEITHAAKQDDTSKATATVTTKTPTQSTFDVEV
ncbi:hypothetical protein [Anatilimnocola floriformis]|uniref:hypothetical protein n=1 Tax=Anatilimnocola floriformis TaxID=2948575 RepID=UPI0020C2F5C3|nr:hypothetical protein [Anatilimnocola floriformis]